jgi:hypothetical protein
MAAALKVVFECHTLPQSGSPSPTCQRLGIQQGNDVVEDIPFAGRAEIHFRFTLQVEEEPDTAKVNFKGKLVQGPRSDRFVYLCWGDRPGGTWEPCGRAKIPLGAIPRQQLQRALTDGKPLRARIRLTGSRGNPAFATLKEDLVEWVNGS